MIVCEIFESDEGLTSLERTPKINLKSLFLHKDTYMTACSLVGADAYYISVAESLYASFSKFELGDILKYGYEFYVIHAKDAMMLTDTLVLPTYIGMGDRVYDNGKLLTYKQDEGVGPPRLPDYNGFYFISTSVEKVGNRYKHQVYFKEFIPYTRTSSVKISLSNARLLRQYMCKVSHALVLSKDIIEPRWSKHAGGKPIDLVTLDTTAHVTDSVKRNYPKFFRKTYYGKCPVVFLSLRQVYYDNKTGIYTLALVRGSYRVTMKVADFGFDNYATYSNPYSIMLAMDKHKLKIYY